MPGGRFVVKLITMSKSHHFASADQSGFLRQVARHLQEGTRLCLVTIVRQSGSSPRGVGTRMALLIDQDGATQALGTVGGGSLEARALEEGRLVLEENRPRLLEVRMKGVEVEQAEMICGGRVTLYLEPLDPADTALVELFQVAARSTLAGERALWLSALPADPEQEPPRPRHLLVVESGPALGDPRDLEALSGILEENLDTWLKQGRPGSLAPPTPAAPAWFYEPLVGRAVVYLFGAGHVARELAALLPRLGFGLVVADDRPEFAHRDHFPQADQIWVRDFNRMLEGEKLPPRAFVVICTRGHAFDKEVLAQVLAQQAAYVGMIGSRRKKATIFKALEQEGVSRELLARVHSPIGLDIGAQTPAEIALSIAAELVAVRAGRDTSSGAAPSLKHGA